MPLIDRVVQALRRVDPRWNAAELPARLAAAGLRPVQAKGRRQTFADADGQRFSFHADAAGGLAFAEADVEVFLGAEALLPADYQATLAEFEARYRRTVAAVEAMLPGGRAFDTPAAAPHDREALRATLWPLGAADLMVTLQHEDRELPIRVVIALEPVGG